MTESLPIQNLEDLSARIAKSQGGMSPNFRRIAAFLFENPDDIALSSMRTNAKQLGLDPSNFVRFAKAMSFSGYPEMRTLFQRNLKDSRTGYLERAQNLQEHERQDRKADLLSQFRTSTSANLYQVFEQNSALALEACADALLSARQVHIFGLRSSFPPAFGLHYVCKMIRHDVHLSDGLAGTFAGNMRGIGPSDVFLSISTYPYSRVTVAATQYAARFGAKIIAITDNALSPLTGKADHILLFKSKGPLLLGTSVPVMALVEALTMVMIANGGEDALKAIEDSERQLREFAAYVDLTGQTLRTGAGTGAVGKLQ